MNDFSVWSRNMFLKFTSSLRVCNWTLLSKSTLLLCIYFPQIERIFLVGGTLFLFKHQGMEETYRALEVSQYYKSQGAPKTYRTHQASPYGYGSRNNRKGKETQTLSVSNTIGPWKATFVSCGSSLSYCLWIYTLNKVSILYFIKVCVFQNQYVISLCMAVKSKKYFFFAKM